MEERLKKFGDRINKKFNGEISAPAGKIPKLKRFRSGSLELDLVLGGGFPFNRISLIVGPESSGKTTILLRACSEIPNYCHNCKERYPCDCGNFESGVVLWIETEGSLDVKWAALNGMDPDGNLVVWPVCGEDAVDIIDTAIRESAADLIVLDSIEATVPSKEVEGSASDQQPGLQARLMNKGFRKWTNGISRHQGNGPALICVNQMREKVGVMFGDPTTLPGGKGQLFHPSIRIRNKKASVHDIAGEAKSAYVEISGTTPKNKTFTPKLEYSFHLALVDHTKSAAGKVVANYEAGEINNIESIIKYGKKLGFITSGGGNWKIDLPDAGISVCEKGKANLISAIREDLDVYETLYDIIVKALT